MDAELPEATSYRPGDRIRWPINDLDGNRIGERVLEVINGDDGYGRVVARGIDGNPHVYALRRDRILGRAP